MQRNSKATFVLPTALLEDSRQLVRDGMAESLSALVREALEARTTELREQNLERQLREAASDPLFLADLQECIQDFDRVPIEGPDD